jgi:hypothetical protein
MGNADNVAVEPDLGHVNRQFRLARGHNLTETTSGDYLRVSVSVIDAGVTCPNDAQCGSTGHMSLALFVQAPLRGAVRGSIDSWAAPQSFWATITMIRNWVDSPSDRDNRERARKILSSGYSPKEKDQQLAALINGARAAERDRTKTRRR